MLFSQQLNQAHSEAICDSCGVKAQRSDLILLGFCERCLHSLSQHASRFKTSNIKVSKQPKCSINTPPSPGGGGRGGVVLGRVSLVCTSVSVCAGVLIQLAFRSLINCHGIWLFWVNAITHAASSINGRLVRLRPFPFFTLLLFSPPPFSRLFWRKVRCAFSAGADAPPGPPAS